MRNSNIEKWKPLTHSLTDTKVYRRCLSVSELKKKIKKLIYFVHKRKKFYFNNSNILKLRYFYQLRFFTQEAPFEAKNANLVKTSRKTNKQI